jgi:hypothetical protein
LLNVIDPGNVLMIQCSQGFGFALKPAYALGITREFVRQELDRDITFQLGVACAIDLSHPAFAEQRSDFVGAELCATGDRHKS